MEIQFPCDPYSPLSVYIDLSDLLTELSAKFQFKKA